MKKLKHSAGAAGDKMRFLSQTAKEKINSGQPSSTESPEITIMYQVVVHQSPTHF